MLGPWLTTADELADPSQLSLKLSVNGEVRQKANSRDLIIDVPGLIAFATRFYSIGWTRWSRQWLYEILAAVQRLPGSPTAAESRPSKIGPISLGVKQTGERSAGNLHAAFDEAGAGNVARSRWCDTRRRKGETTGNTNFDLNRRASPRPYQWTGSG